MGNVDDFSQQMGPDILLHSLSLSASTFFLWNLVSNTALCSVHSELVM